MASDNSFDVVSKVDLAEVKNAVDQATKEIHQRFDLKDSKSSIAIEGADVIQLASQDEYKLEAVKEILRQKLVKRGVSLKNLEYEKLEPAANSSVRQKIKMMQGIPSDKARQIAALVKEMKLKASPAFRAIPCAWSARTATRYSRSWPSCAPVTSASRCSSPTTATSVETAGMHRTHRIPATTCYSKIQ